jgi:hypothetical protein
LRKRLSDLLVDAGTVGTEIRQRHGSGWPLRLAQTRNRLTHLEPGLESPDAPVLYAESRRVYWLIVACLVRELLPEADTSGMFQRNQEYVAALRRGMA